MVKVKVCFFYPILHKLCYISERRKATLCLFPLCLFCKPSNCTKIPVSRWGTAGDNRRKTQKSIIQTMHVTLELLEDKEHAIKTLELSKIFEIFVMKFFFFRICIEDSELLISWNLGYRSPMPATQQNLS